MIEVGRVPFETIERWAEIAGLDLFAVHASVPDLSLDAERLRAWQASGSAGQMEYMLGDPELLSGPLTLLPALKSVVSFAVYYDRRPSPSHGGRLPLGYGRVARYAWGRDYHRVLKAALKRFVKEAERDLGRSVQARYFSDAVPLLERALARESGLGFVGKNTMLIRSGGLGSFFFLAELLWDVEVDTSAQRVAPDDSCGTCTRCLGACPTRAFTDPYTLDASKCISYLSIEKRTALSLEERRALGEWVFGCDICQEVCPFNAQSLKREAPPSIEEIGAEFGVGALLNLSQVLALRSHAAFTARFEGTSLMRATRAGLLRNAAVVAANTQAEATVPALREALVDDAEIVRSHALWALLTLGAEGNALPKAEQQAILERAKHDTSNMVRGEALLWEQTH